MTPRITLVHKTVYEYDRPVSLMPQIVRLHPAPHSRTPVASYGLMVDPARHILHWQFDAWGNRVAHLIFPDKTERLSIEVQLVADMVPINCFDFVLDESACYHPFTYESSLQRQLGPYLEVDPATPVMRRFLDSFSTERWYTADRVVDLNQRIFREVTYVMRPEPGVQSPEQTLTTARGSCRDMSWLAVAALRHMGFAARFVSGYTVQLKCNPEELEKSGGLEPDCTELHAWAEVYLPGAGWVALDPATGMLAGQGYIPLACSPEPAQAAPVTGAVEPCISTLHAQMAVARFDPTPPWQDVADEVLPARSRRGA